MELSNEIIIWTIWLLSSIITFLFTRKQNNAQANKTNAEAKNIEADTMGKRIEVMNKLIETATGQVDSLREQLKQVEKDLDENKRLLDEMTEENKKLTKRIAILEENEGWMKRELEIREERKIKS